MTLTQQFLATMALPLTFVLLAVYAWRKGADPATRLWAVALLVLAFWAGSILSFYAGLAFPQEVAFFWRVSGRHALSLFALLLLLVSTRFLASPRSQTRGLLSIGLFFWVASLLLDPASLRLIRAPVAAGTFYVTPFSLWAGVWVASWLVPLLAALLLTRQRARVAPPSLYRNRLNYWQLSLVGLMGAGALGLVQQHQQPAWQEISALVHIGAAFLGTQTLLRHELRDLKMALRQIAARLASSLIIFSLTWAALWFLAHNIPRRNRVDTSLDLIVGAAVFAALFMLVNRFVVTTVRWLFLPRRQHPRTLLAEEPELAHKLSDPARLSRLILHFMQTRLVTEQASLFCVETGPGGGLLLVPLASLQEDALPVSLSLSGSSPLTHFLLRESMVPLATYDLDHVTTFSEMPAEERDTLRQWGSQFLLPLHAGRKLAGVLALGGKFTGAPYREEEMAWLQVLAAQVGPLLWQAQQIAMMERLNRYVFERIETLAQQQQFLQELSVLYQQFTGLVSPELYGPFKEINQALSVQESQGETTATVTQPVTRLRTMVGHLVNVAGRVQEQHEFQFAPMSFNEVIQQATRNLAQMAEARRVHVTIGGDPHLPPIKGDQQRLTEAVQHLLHNAIKFNKIGGKVELECGTAGNELYLHIRDTGVGVPSERLEEIWTTFNRHQNGRYQGSSEGLGLLLARFIVRAHGGQIEAQSHYGSGSVFSIRLPLTLEA